MDKLDHSIYVTQPSLPDLGEYKLLLDQIWDSKVITNSGPFHEEFEKKLAAHLGVKYISLFNNATIGLLTALQVLEIKGEVITTPYSFVATANSLMWNNLTPVFCDVDPVYGNINASKIESLITDSTSAILPVHVYGNPADVEQIQNIADKHQLKVIYDAAHAFGVEINQNSILNYGHLSVVSFHATKTFNTVEGGAIISHDIETKQKIDQLKNFGITDEVTVVAPGINGKVNELIAAYGLIQLKSINSEIEKSKIIAQFYRSKLNGIPGLRFLDNIASITHNYSYFPIFINKVDFGLTRDELFDKLKDHNVFARRYFYPLISDFPTYQNFPTSKPSNLVCAKKMAEEVICLPIYAELSLKIVDYIVNIIKSSERE